MQCGGLSLTAVLQKYHFLLQLLKQNQMSQIDSAKCIFNYVARVVCTSDTSSDRSQKTRLLFSRTCAQRWQQSKYHTLVVFFLLSHVQDRN